MKNLKLYLIYVANLFFIHLEGTSQTTVIRNNSTINVFDCWENEVNRNKLLLIKF